MKNNLKTFPRTAEGENRDEADIWAENIEKELRQELAYAEKSERAWMGQDKHRIDREVAWEWKGIRIAIRHFLGES